jgi:hypothetical protein
MMMEKSLLWGRLALASMMVLGLASCRKNTGTEPQRFSSAAAPHGELISLSAPAATAIPASSSTNQPPRKKYPKPPSVQRRMVLAELTLLSQSNSDYASMSSGTAGTAADLAKTNLPSIASLSVPDLRIPGYQNITFSTLSDFNFELTPEMADATAHPEKATALATAQIPAAVRSLDGSKVVLEGFLLPVTMNNGLAVEFLLMRNQSMCCYGVPPKINEWITVQLNGKGVKPVMDRPIAVAGVLHVGAIEENGCLDGIYRLDGEKVVTPF